MLQLNHGRGKLARTLFGALITNNVSVSTFSNSKDKLREDVRDTRQAFGYPEHNGRHNRRSVAIVSPLYILYLVGGCT